MSIFIFFFDTYAVHVHTISLCVSHVDNTQFYRHDRRHKLFRFAEQGEHHADRATKESLRYRTALKDGFSSLETRPLSTATAVAVCRTIKNTDLDIQRVPGTKLPNTESGKAIYTPPEGESLIREKLANWETFLHQETDLDPLVRMAVAHYPFEAIHPFTDGNGRTWRILNILFLCDQQLITIPVLYLSSFINKNRSDYYYLLLSVTSDGNWTDWIEYMLEGIRTTAQDTCNRIDAINALRDQVRQEIRESLLKIYSHELVEQLFAQPYTRISNMVEVGIAKRQTASNANKVQLAFLRPGKPTDNAYIESFNGSFRDVCLNLHWDDSLPDAKIKVEAWRMDYNECRPHRALNNLSPAEAVASLAA